MAKKKRSVSRSLSSSSSGSRNMNMRMKCYKGCGNMGSGYFLGFLGALIYYVQVSTGFWGTILGILKAIVWPAFLVYKLFVM